MIPPSHSIELTRYGIRAERGTAPRFFTSHTEGVTLLLAPASSDDLVGQLADVFQATNQLTAWAHALLNIVLYPLDPKPDWYDPLNDALQEANAGTLDWVTVQGPAIAAGVPQAYIDYANLFGAAATQLQKQVSAAVAQPDGQPTPDQVQALIQILMALRGQAADSATGVSTLQAEMSAFAGQLGTWRTTIGTAVQAANATITADRADVDAMQSQIASLLEKLGASTEDANNAAKSAAIAAVSLVLTVLTFTIVSSVTAGAAVPVMAIAGGLISTSTGSTEATLSEREVDTDLAAITELQARLTAENQQIAAIQNIVRTANGRLTAAEALGHREYSMTKLYRSA